MGAYGVGPISTDSSSDLRRRVPMGGGGGGSANPINQWNTLTTGTPLAGTAPGGSPGGMPGIPGSPGGGTFGGPVLGGMTPPGLSNPTGTTPNTNPAQGVNLGSGSTIASSDIGTAAAKPGNTSNKNLQTVLANLYNRDIGTQGQLLGQQENLLNFANLPNTPLYKTNLALTNSQTSSAYDQAVANARARANSSGFGYTSPVEQGGETAIRGQEAGALAKNPSTALLQTVQPELEAAGMIGQDMSQFNPNSLLLDWTNLVNNKSQSSAGLMAGLMQALSSMGSSVIDQNPGGVFGP